jgi:hypothetical protein
VHFTEDNRDAGDVAGEIRASKGRASKSRTDKRTRTGADASVGAAARALRGSALWRWATLGAALLVTACANRPPPAVPAPPPGGAEGARAVPMPGSVGSSAKPVTRPGANGNGGTASALPLPPPGPVRSMDELRQQAARRLVAANPELTYTKRPPEILLAIPVLEIELNVDGSIRKIDVLRHPSQARDTTQLAIDAVKRAAPFGELGRVPKPWKFAETFLFDDDRRFKPMTLDR